MAEFDPRPIILFTFSVLILLLFILFSLYRSIPRKMEGLKEGVLAGLAWAVGGGLILTRTFLPDILSIVLGNMAFSGAALLMYSALQGFSGAAAPVRTLLPIVVLSYGCILWMAMTVSPYASVIVLITFVNTIGFFFCFRAAQRLQSGSFVARFVVTVFAFALVVSAVRFGTVLGGYFIPQSAFGTVPFQKFYLVVMAFLTNAILVGFTLLTYQRLRDIVLHANIWLESEVAVRTADLRLELERKAILERRIETIAEEERQKIGNELHDDLGQRLTGITLVAEGLIRGLQDHNATMRDHAGAIQHEAVLAMDQIRRLVHGLMPVGPEPAGFRIALEQLAQSACVADFRCSVEYDEPVDIADQHVANNLFRIAQQALNNTISHARATVLVMRLDLIKDKLSFSITDNGCGFLLPAAGTSMRTGSSGNHGSGYGMGIMEARASVIDFRLTVDSQPGAGTTIRAMQC